MMTLLSVSVFPSVSPVPMSLSPVVLFNILSVAVFVIRDRFVKSRLVLKSLFLCNKVLSYFSLLLSSLSVYLCLCVSLSLSFSFCFCLSVSVSLFLSVCLSLSVSLSVRLCLSLSLSLSVCLALSNLLRFLSRQHLSWRFNLYHACHVLQTDEE